MRKQMGFSLLLTVWLRLNVCRWVEGGGRMAFPIIAFAGKVECMAAVNRPCNLYFVFIFELVFVFVFVLVFVFEIVFASALVFSNNCIC